MTCIPAGSTASNPCHRKRAIEAQSAYKKIRTSGPRIFPLRPEKNAIRHGISRTIRMIRYGERRIGPTNNWMGNIRPQKNSDTIIRFNRRRRRSRFVPDEWRCLNAVEVPKEVSGVIGQIARLTCWQLRDHLSLRIPFLLTPREIWIVGFCNSIIA